MENSIVKNQNLNEDLFDSFNLDELEKKIQEDLHVQFQDLEVLKQESQVIGNPENFGELIQNLIWEQFSNQIAINQSKEFIKENGNQTLDLRKDSHIQTTENFAKGKIATHNTEIDFQKRYDNWKSNFQTDSNIEGKPSNYRYNADQQVLEKHDSRSNTWKKVLKKDARSDFDRGRPKGNVTSNTNMDHTVSAGEIIRDPAANAHMNREEQVSFANSDKNLNLMDSAANQSKGDSTMTEFLNSKRNGKKASERFNIDEEALRKKDEEARKEYEKRKKEAEQRSIESGKKSRRQEAVRIGKQATKTLILSLLSELIKEVISKMVEWFKKKERTVSSLIEKLTESIHAFIQKLGNHILNATKSVFNMIASSIIGPIAGLLSKIGMLLKQSWKSLVEAINYLKNPENKGKSFDRIILEIGKIIIGGLTSIGALLLSEVVEKGLSSIPGFAIDIPGLGSLANILGLFFGTMISGIVGAIGINIIDSIIAKKQKSENVNLQVEKANTILSLQTQLQDINEKKMINEKNNVALTIANRHFNANKEIENALENINHNCEEESFEDTLNDINRLFEEWEN